MDIKQSKWEEEWKSICYAWVCPDDRAYIEEQGLKFIKSLLAQ